MNKKNILIMTLIALLGAAPGFAERTAGEMSLESLMALQGADREFDQIFAARRGDKAAVILLQFEPVAGGTEAGTEAEEETELTGFLGFLSRIFGGQSDRKPVYYNLYMNFMGCRVHSSLHTTLSGKGDVWDFSLAKAEIPAKGESQGTWTLTGHITAFVKNKTFIARRASLTDPSGKVVAVADEITVAVDDPAGYRVQGSRLADKKAAERINSAAAGR